MGKQMLSNTEVKDQNQDQKEFELSTKGFDIEKIQQLLDETLPKLNLIANKDIVLVIGNTGAGKSTTINYQLRRKLTEIDNCGDESLDLAFAYDQKEDNTLKSAKIGHSSESETFTPSLYKGDFNITYCDCPGFIENRSDEKAVITAINTRKAIKLAKSIKSIMVVIDYNSFITDKGEGIKILSKTLGGLLRNPSDIEKSVSFIITKAKSNATVRSVQKRASNLLSAYENQYRNLSTPNKNESTSTNKVKEKEEIISAISLMNLIKNNPENIILINVNNSSSREKIHNLILGSKKINKENFSLIPQDKIYKKFEDVLFNITEKHTYLINLLSSHEKSIEDYQQQLIRYQKNALEFKKVIAESDLKKSNLASQLGLTQTTAIKEMLAEDQKLTDNQMKLHGKGLKENQISIDHIESDIKKYRDQHKKIREFIDSNRILFLTIAKLFSSLEYDLFSPTIREFLGYYSENLAHYKSYSSQTTSAENNLMCKRNFKDNLAFFKSIENKKSVFSKIFDEEKTQKINPIKHKFHDAH